MQLMGKNKSFYRISLYYITIDNMHNNQIGLSHTKQKINSKWIKVLYVRLENRKVLKGNMGYTLFDISQMT